MTGNTHFSLGLAAGAMTVAVNGSAGDVAAIVATVAVASLGSLLPDIDEEGSMLNNLLFRAIKNRSAALSILGAITIILAFLKNLDLWVLLAGVYAMAVAFIPHRSFTHSILSLMIITWITYMAEPEYALAMAAGYISHLLADMVTVMGVPLLWPWKKKIGLKQFFGIKVKSGDHVDKMTGKISMYIGCIGLVWLLFQDIALDMVVSQAENHWNSLIHLFAF